MFTHDQFNAMLPKKDRARSAAQYARFEADTAEALRNGDWEGYMIRFGGNESLKPFVEIERRMSDAEYWPMLKQIWASMDFAAPDRRTWERLLFRNRPTAGAAAMMNKSERETFAALPDSFTIYRGQQSSRHRPGFSWTLSRERAEWFATTDRSSRINLETNRVWKRGNGVVFEGTVRKSDVLCYLNGRTEKEILVHPDNVRRVRKV